MERGEIVKTSKDYFESILTVNLGKGKQDILSYIAEYCIENLSFEEVKKVIKCLKCNKAPGTDESSAKLLKNGGE